jgi:hypothetical protein
LFLTDIYARAQTMEKIFNQGTAALQSFLNGPAAQLIAASQTQPTATLPNSVIYGWVDNTYPNGQKGYAHIVKVTAYSPGRNGNGTFGLSQLPYIKTTSHIFTRDYTLDNRDGPVYVSVKRWDEDHSNSTIFPNGRPLWQFMFHNPQGGVSTAGTGLPTVCKGLNSGTIGFGLEPGTVHGLTSAQAQISPTDLTALGNAFMLNDKGDGSAQVDPSATSGSSYDACLAAANQLLANAPESHACVQYVASSPSSDSSSVQSGTSQFGDRDYSLKFYACPSQREDLGSSSS